MIYNSFNQLAGIDDSEMSNMSIFNAPGVSADTPDCGMRYYTSFNELATENGIFDWFRGKSAEPDVKWVYPMKQLDSSYLAKVGYNGNSHTMDVQFWDGSIFQYSGVSEPEYKKLMEADSHGQWFYWNIRTNKPWKQLEGRKTTSKPGYATRLKSKSSEWTGSPW